MSRETQAAADFRVKYVRGVHEDGREREQREVEILDDGEQHPDLSLQRAGTQAPKNLSAVNRRGFRKFKVTLGVMYLLILAGFVIRYILVTLEKDQLETEVLDLEANNSRLQRRYETLSLNHSLLQDEVKKLRDTIEGKWCPGGWNRSGCSCYFKSTQWKTWDESRTDCQSKGADLVIINNKEEQEFVSKLSMNEESWIGLAKKWTSQGWEWEWVDGSPLTETFWAEGQPEYRKHYAVCCSQHGQWTSPYSSAYTKKWICEKQISYFH